MLVVEVILCYSGDCGVGDDNNENYGDTLHIWLS